MITLYTQAVAAYEQAGTQDTDTGYPAVLANIGLLNYGENKQKTRQGAELALPWWGRAVVAYDALLGPAHPSSVRSRSELVGLLRDGLGRRREAARVEAGGAIETMETATRES
jgi:hypothetical protein